MCSPYPEFVLTGVIYIEKGLKGNEFRINRVRTNEVLLSLVDDCKISS